MLRYIREGIKGMSKKFYRGSSANFYSKKQYIKNGNDNCGQKINNKTGGRGAQPQGWEAELLSDKKST